MKKLLIAAIATMSLSSAYANEAQVIAYSSSGTKGYSTIIVSDHKVIITNDFNTDTTYQYRFRLCVPALNKCSEAFQPVTLKPHERKELVGEQMLTLQFNFSGHYESVATTGIYGPNPTEKTVYGGISIY